MVKLYSCSSSEPVPADDYRWWVMTNRCQEFVSHGKTIQGEGEAAGLKVRGYDLYSMGDPGRKMFRLMTAFDTRPGEDALLAALRRQGPVRVNVP